MRENDGEDVSEKKGRGSFDKKQVATKMRKQEQTRKESKTQG